MLDISISPSTLKLGLQFAEQRNKKARRFGDKTYANKQGGLMAHSIGIVAELAVANLFQVKFDDRIFDNHGDDGVDLVLPVVGCTAVKATTYLKDPLLRVEIKRAFPIISIYIGCAVDSANLRKVYMFGWQYSVLVEAAKQRKFSQYGPLNYVLDESQLRNPEELIEIVKEGNGSGPN